MNKKVFLGFILVITAIFMVPSCDAWNSGVGDTHDTIAVNLYHDTPSTIRKHLDLKEMKRGARWPDYNGESKKWHGYPYSTIKIEKYLILAKKAYRTKSYKKESFYYGVVSHYVSDTYAAPHTVKKLSFHKRYYYQADLMAIHAYKMNYNELKNFLKYGYNLGQGSADTWERKRLWNNKFSALVQKDLNRAYSSTLAVIRKAIGF
jgi:hypothetical protein